MKILKIFLTLSLVLILSSASVAGNVSGKLPVFPDLLQDEFEDEDEYSEDEDSEGDFTVNDPLEPMNRVFFEFNDLFYEWVLEPVTDGYIWVMPEELRVSFGNFFVNLAMPIRLINTILQGEFKDSGIVLSRFVINSTIGVWGLVDVADLQWGIKRRRADFGQTLGRWGVGEGIYFCWPFLGPSNVRDSIGFAVDVYSHPVPYLHDETIFDVAYYATNRVNAFSLNPDLYSDLKEFALDPYVASRQAYFEYRRAIIARPEKE